MKFYLSCCNNGSMCATCLKLDALIAGILHYASKIVYKSNFKA